MPHSIRADSQQRRKPLAPQPADPKMQAPEPDSGIDPLVVRASLEPGRLRPSDVLRLQRLVGNRAVSQMLAAGRQAIGPVQARLTVGPVADPYEQEADRVAEQVLAAPREGGARSDPPRVQRQEEEEEVQTQPLAAPITPLVQRAAEEEEEVQAKPGPRDAGPTVQRRHDGSFEAGPALEQQLVTGKGGGSPLPADVRAYMEPRFGADFGGVKLHTGPEAAKLNRQIQAQAFTHGQDIYLGAGHYEPGTEAGKRLLAHELVHTIQQTGGVHPKRGYAGLRPRLRDRSKAVQAISTARGVIQRFIGSQGKKGQIVFKYQDRGNVPCEITEVLRGGQAYNLKASKSGNEYTEVDRYDPDYGRSEGRRSEKLAVNKALISAAGATIPVEPGKPEFGTYRWYRLRADDAVPFPDAVGDDKVDMFGWHFNQYWLEARKGGLDTGLRDLIMAMMLELDPRCVETVGTKKQVKKGTRLQRTDIYWKEPASDRVKRFILNRLHKATMKDMVTEKIIRKVTGKADQEEGLKKPGAELTHTEAEIPGEKIGIGFHGTGRTAYTVYEVHKGTKPMAMTLVKGGKFLYEKMPHYSPIYKALKAGRGAFFRMGQKDNELFTTVSIATNFEASTDFPLVHQMPEAPPGTTPTRDQNQKWRDDKWDFGEGQLPQSYTTVFIVGVKEGYDTNALQQLLGTPQVGAHGEKATGTIPVEYHFGYVEYQRYHYGEFREDGHDFVPLKAENKVDKTRFPKLYKQIEDILTNMNKEGSHQGG